MTDSDEFIDINTIIKNNNDEDHNSVYNNYSNFSEVIRENNNNTINNNINNNDNNNDNNNENN